ALGTPTNGRTPQSVNLVAGGANFQAGDLVEEPVGYNYHGTGVEAVLSREIGEPMGSGVYVPNVGTGAFGQVLRATGPFLTGILIDSALSQDGLVFTKPIAGGYGPMLKSTDISAANTRLALVLNSAGAVRAIDYNRTGE